MAQTSEVAAALGKAQFTVTDQIRPWGGDFRSLGRRIAPDPLSLPNHAIMTPELLTGALARPEVIGPILDRINKMNRIVVCAGNRQQILEILLILSI